MADLLNNTIVILNLAAGATTTVPHMISYGGVPREPNWVTPNTLTSIGVQSYNTTTITFVNHGTQAESAEFVVKLDHSIQRDPTDTVGLSIWRGGAYAALTGGTVDLGGQRIVIWVDNLNGDDTTGDGSAGNPYYSLEFALSTIPKSFTNGRYVVDITGYSDPLADDFYFPVFDGPPTLYGKGYNQVSGQEYDCFTYEGGVTIQAEPQVDSSYTFASQSNVDGLWRIVANEALVPSAHAEQFLRIGSQLLPIIDNTATYFLTTLSTGVGAGTAMHVCDLGAEFPSIAAATNFNIAGQHTPIVVNGVLFSKSGGGIANVNYNLSNNGTVLMYACDFISDFLQDEANASLEFYSCMFRDQFYGINGTRGADVYSVKTLFKGCWTMYNNEIPGGNVTYSDCHVTGGGRIGAKNGYINLSGRIENTYIYVTSQGAVLAHMVLGQIVADYNSHCLIAALTGTGAENTIYAKNGSQIGLITAACNGVTEASNKVLTCGAMASINWPAWTGNLFDEGVASSTGSRIYAYT